MSLYPSTEDRDCAQTRHRRSKMKSEWTLLSLITFWLFRDRVNKLGLSCAKLNTQALQLGKVWKLSRWSFLSDIITHVGEGGYISPSYYKGHWATTNACTNILNMSEVDCYKATSHSAQHVYDCTIEQYFLLCDWLAITHSAV